MTVDTIPIDRPGAAEMPSREGDFTIEGHGFEPIPESGRGNPVPELVARL